MPKLKERPEEAQDRMFRALVAKNMELCGIHEQKELATRIGIGETAMVYKMQEPDKFRRKELRRIFQVLKFTEEEKGQVV